MSAAEDVRPARADELDEAVALLAACGLPPAGVEDQFPGAYLVLRDAGTGTLAGLAGVEAFGGDGLLRSVAVSETKRGTGLGRRLTAAALEHARARGVRSLYLLTETAGGFFPRFGFERVERAELPASLEGSAELRGACPASALAMRLRL
ncbi:MAG TPA: arsenic resistance N-acetyltransferase ArsN2 [Longimicrobiaceae bacterium]|nr:arsenic resistance N-acetyltransferase ArsN2 [Longimicrobiaceae bacterium]